MIYKYVYKTVAALAALSVIPLTLFGKMVYVLGEVSLGKTYVYEEMSLYEIYVDFIRTSGGFSSMRDMELTDAVRNVLPLLITAGVFYAAALLIAVAIAVTAFACRSRLPVLILSAVGFVCMICVYIFFNRFALPFTDGTIGVGDLTDGLLGMILGAVLNIERLKLSSGALFSTLTFVGVFLWTGAYMVVDLGDKDAKPKKAANSH